MALHVLTCAVASFEIDINFRSVQVIRLIERNSYQRPDFCSRTSQLVGALIQAVVLLNVLGCRLTYYGQVETNAEAWFSIALCPRKPEGSLGRTAQDGHLDSHTAP